MTDRLEEKAREWLTLQQESDEHWLEKLTAILRSVADEARREEAAKCADIAHGMRMAGPSVIGPLHGAGWDGAVGHIVNALRDRSVKHG